MTFARTYNHRLLPLMIVIITALDSVIGQTRRVATDPNNLVMDSGFEQYKDLPDDEAQGYKLKFWQSPNNNIPTYPNATPDYLHMDGKGAARLPDSYYGVVQPHSGKGILGLVMKSSAADNFREYMSTRLLRPLEPGKTYKITFFLTNGTDKFYGDYGSSHFGLLFSSSMPRQQEHEVLNLKPQLEIGEVFFSTAWEKFTLTFTPEKPYEYLTLGCFREDSRVQQRHRQTKAVPNRAEFTYLFVDDVSVIGEEAPIAIAEEQFAESQRKLEQRKLAEQRKLREQEQQAQQTVVPQVPVSTPPEPSGLARVEKSKSVPNRIEHRRVERQGTVEVSNQRIFVEVYDARAEDRDTVSLNWNGQWVLQRAMVRNKPLVLELELDPTANNTLIFYAHNLGTIPPNTAVVAYMDKGRKKLLEVESDLKKCGAVTFKIKE